MKLLVSEENRGYFIDSILEYMKDLKPISRSFSCSSHWVVWSQLLLVPGQDELFAFRLFRQSDALTRSALHKHQVWVTVSPPPAPHYVWPVS